MNFWLTGELVSEYTNATTTQLVDATSRSWATSLLADLQLPDRLLTPIVEPGTEIGSLALEGNMLAGTPVIVPACHDTGSAVAAVSLTPGSAFLSSGTWSLLGAELPGPVITPQARDLNFTNEGGVCGTTRLLKNIAGLWLLQACCGSWAAEGQTFTYKELLEEAAGQQDTFRSLFNPDDPVFLNPEHMPSAIASYCRRANSTTPLLPPRRNSLARFSRASHSSTGPCWNLWKR